MIDAAPLPGTVKDAAARITRGPSAQGTSTLGAGSAPESIGTPGVESAGGRDRTAPGGDLPSDLARP